MTSDDFEKWYAKPLALLNDDPDGALAVLMVSLPLLDIRERSKAVPAAKAVAGR
jgi:hypothetical protein